jgi:nucleoside-diphosphate-sugar epimerase
MPDALVGHTGFVGSTLLRQRRFDACYRSTDIGEIAGREFDTIVCAGAPAQKWIANGDPAADRANIDKLMHALERVRCRTFVLMSTVDVFKSPNGTDEDSPVDVEGLHAYGTHRRLLETFVEQRFAGHLIVRLAGLVGPGLRKNVIYDFLNDNNVDQIDCRGVFQFYPMINLWYDTCTALQAGLKLVHFTAEPISVADVAREGFGFPFTHELPKPAARYDFRTRHAALFGGTAPYQYSRRDTVQAIRAYAQSEPRTKKG